MDSSTLSKICFYGSDFMEALQKDIDMASIPAMLGGTYREFNEPFVFDVTEGGALYHAGGSEILITPRIGTEDTQQDVSKDSETVTNRL